MDKQNKKTTSIYTRIEIEKIFYKIYLFYLQLIYHVG